MSEKIAQLSIKKRWNTKVSFLQPRPVRLVKTGYYNEQYENIVSDRTRIDNALYDLSCQMKDLQSDYTKTCKISNPNVEIIQRIIHVLHMLPRNAYGHKLINCSRYGLMFLLTKKKTNTTIS